MNDGLQITIGVISSLVLFLYGLENLSAEIQQMASNKFRIIISKLSKNRISGMIIGAISTALVQSSSAITSLSVVLVSTSIITFKQSLGIIFGANIGTTVTAQLALINIALLGPAMIIVGFLFKIMGKRYKLISKPIFFTGFVLFSLQLLSMSVASVKDTVWVIEILSQLNNPLIALAVSAVFTGLLQSSSVTSGIVVILAQNGLIDLTTAIPMILGANVGSSLTALIASLELDVYAKRTGLANFLFNIAGALGFFIILNQFIFLVEQTQGTVATQTAYAHLIFNGVNAILFMIILTPFAKLVEKLIHTDENEIQFRTFYIDKRTENMSFVKQIKAIRKELLHAIDNTIEIYKYAMNIYVKPSKLNMMQIEKLETYNDYLDDEITVAIIEVSKMSLTEKRAEKTVVFIRVSNIIEQIGDLGKDLANIFLKMHNSGTAPSSFKISILNDLHQQLNDLFQVLKKGIEQNSDKNIEEIKKHETKISKYIQTQFDLHVKRLEEDEKYVGTILVDSLSIFELAVAKVREIRKTISS